MKNINRLKYFIRAKISITFRSISIKPLSSTRKDNKRDNYLPKSLLRLNDTFSSLRNHSFQINGKRFTISQSIFAISRVIAEILRNHLYERFPNLSELGAKERSEFKRSFSKFPFHLDEEKEVEVNFFNLPEAVNFNIEIAALSRASKNNYTACILFMDYLYEISLMEDDKFFQNMSNSEKLQICNINLNLFFTYDSQVKLLINILKSAVRRNDLKLDDYRQSLLTFIEMIEGGMVNFPIDPFFNYRNKQKFHNIVRNITFIFNPLYVNLGYRGLGNLIGLPILFLLNAIKIITPVIKFLRPFWKEKKLLIGIINLLHYFKTNYIQTKTPFHLLLFFVPGVGIFLQCWEKGQMVFCIPGKGEDIVTSGYKMARNSIKSFIRDFTACRIVNNHDKFNQKFDPARGDSEKVAGELILRARRWDFYNFKRLHKFMPHFAAPNTIRHSYRELARVETKILAQKFPIAGTHSQLLAVSLEDAGNIGKGSYETHTAVLVADQIKKGPVTPGVMYNRHAADFCINKRAYEIKPGDSYIGKKGGVLNALQDLEAERERTQQSDLVFVLDGSSYPSHVTDKFRSLLQEYHISSNDIQVYHPDDVLIVNSNANSTMVDLMTNVSPNTADIENNIDGLVYSIPAHLYRLLNQPKIRVEPDMQREIDRQVGPIIDKSLFDEE